jgi:hypothetical protein
VDDLGNCSLQPLAGGYISAVYPSSAEDGKWKM